MELATMDIATVDHLLTTTRSVRKRLDLTRAVEPEVIERCIEIATQAPSGSNRQGWHFMVVTDSAKRKAIAEYYRKSFEVYIGSGGPRGRGKEDDPRHARASKVRDSVLGIPPNITQAALLPVAYFTGDDFQPAKRVPARELTYWDQWGATR